MVKAFLDINWTNIAIGASSHPPAWLQVNENLYSQAKILGSYILVM